MRGRLALVACLLVALPAVADDKIVRTAQALYDGVDHFTLDNGLRVYLKPVPGSPVVSTLVGYKVGSADEELDQTGLSHYLEHLMFKGTATKKPGDIDRITQRNGGQNNAFTTEDMTVYHFDFAADRWRAALEVEADRMRNLRIDEEHEFQQEKGAVISELDMYEDQAWDLEQKLIAPLLFGKDAPYGHPIIGEKAHVRDVKAETIKKHYDRWYHPNNAVLVIAGGFDAVEAKAAVRKLFGGIPKGDLPKRKVAPVLKPRTEVVRKTFDSKFPTPRLLMGFNGVAETDADSVVLDVVASLLTDGKTSRLHKRFIEEDGTATDVTTGNQAGRHPGWFAVQVELYKADEMAKVEATVNDELKKLATDGPTPAELNRVRRSMAAAHIFAHEDVHELADTITRGVVANDLDFVRTYLPNLVKVSGDDVKRVVRKYFLDAKPVVIESRPKKDGNHAFSLPERGSEGVRSLLRRDVSAKAGASFDPKLAKTVVLDNGLKLLLLENKRLPIVVVEAWVRDIKLREPADKTGLASLMGSVLEEGTPTRTGPEIAQAIEDVGGSLVMSSSGGSVKVLTDDTALGLDLMFDCLINPEFGKDEVESKREQLLAQLVEEEELSDKRASKAFRAMLYGDHPYGRPSAKSEVVKKLSPDELKAFHRSVFVPNNTVIAVVGDFDSEAIVEGIKKRTAEWKKAALPAIKIAAAPDRQDVRQKVFTDASAGQLTIFLGHLGVRRNDPDFFKLLVMDYVLGTGAGFTDRLSSQLRDRQGLAYSVSAGITDTAGEQPGLFTAYIGTFPDKFAEAKAGFQKEIDRIRAEPPTEDEVEGVKNYLLGVQAFSLTTCGEAADLLLSIERYNLGTDYLADYRKGVQSVTPADVLAVAKKHLHPDRLLLVASGAVDAEGKPLKK